MIGSSLFILIALGVVGFPIYIVVRYILKKFVQSKRAVLWLSVVIALIISMEALQFIADIGMSSGNDVKPEIDSNKDSSNVSDTLWNKFDSLHLI